MKKIKTPRTDWKKSTKKELCARIAEKINSSPAIRRKKAKDFLLSEARNFAMVSLGANGWEKVNVSFEQVYDLDKLTNQNQSK